MLKVSYAELMLVIFQKNTCKTKVILQASDRHTFQSYPASLDMSETPSVEGTISLINPLSPHDALNHHFTSLKTDLIFLQLSVLERIFP